MADFSKFNGYNVKDAKSGKSLSISGSNLSLKNAAGTTISTVALPSGGATRLTELQDVSIYNPQDGDVLTYSSSMGTWVAEQSGGGGGEQLPVIIDVGRIVHQNGIPTQTIVDVPQNNYKVSFDRQIMFTYRAFNSDMYNLFWTGMPDAYKIGLIDSGGTIRGNAEDLHWIVQDLIDNGQLPLSQNIEYRLVMYKVISNQTYLFEMPLWLTTNTTSTEIDFYLDSTDFTVRQVRFIGADS